MNDCLLHRLRETSPTDNTKTKLSHKGFTPISPVLKHLWGKFPLSSGTVREREHPRNRTFEVNHECDVACAGGPGHRDFCWFCLAEDPTSTGRSARVFPLPVWAESSLSSISCGEAGALPSVQTGSHSSQDLGIAHGTGWPAPRCSLRPTRRGDGSDTTSNRVGRKHPGRSHESDVQAMGRSPSFARPIRVFHPATWCTRTRSDGSMACNRCSASCAGSVRTQR